MPLVDFFTSINLQKLVTLLTFFFSLLIYIYAHEVRLQQLVCVFTKLLRCTKITSTRITNLPDQQNKVLVCPIYITWDFQRSSKFFLESWNAMPLQSSNSRTVWESGSS